MIDEAGAIARSIGKGTRALLTGPNTHLLAIGNPPTDDEDSWLEELCRTAGVAVVQIAVEDTPNFTGESAGRCRACPPELDPHDVKTHLVDREWERDTRHDYGDTSAYYIAKALARFPKNATRRTIPAAWVENAVDLAQRGVADRPVTVYDRLTGTAAACQPEQGSLVRLGVDVAADGGDELAIARCEGDVVRVVHVSSGPQNAHGMTVAGVIKEQIEEAHALRRRLGTPDTPEYALRVKVDVIGIGFGIVGILDAWASELMYSGPTVIVPVDVREGLDEKRKKRPEAATLRPSRKRDELWLAGRAALQPARSDAALAGVTVMGEPDYLLDIDRTTAAQLSNPDYTTNSRGETVIESKKSMKERGLPSPDRAEAVLLSIYEPGDIVRRKRRLVVAGA